MLGEIMSAYLYTWNPNLAYWDDLQDDVIRVKKREKFDVRWSCGNTKKIEIGDIFFLIRLGVTPKGIIGCGYITSTPYYLPHWDQEKADAGKESLRTDLLFVALSEEPIVSLDFLQQKYPTHKWAPQASGTTIPQNIAQELFLLIQESEKFSFPPVSKHDIEVYVEGKSKVVTYKTYDRSHAARQACIEHYGYKCTVCGFSFEDVYGSIGSKYIEVHHLRQLADSDEEYIVNPIQDLRPVCANCHRMLHKTRPPLSIEELRITRR